MQCFHRVFLCVCVVMALKMASTMLKSIKKQKKNAFELPMALTISIDDLYKSLMHWKSCQIPLSNESLHLLSMGKI